MGILDALKDLKTDEAISAFTALVSLGVLAVTSIQAWRQDRLLKRTKTMEVKVNRLAVQLDQSLQLLYHARDQAKRLQHLFIITRDFSQQTEENKASLYTHVTDLEALIRIIGNEKVKKVWHEEIGKVIRTHGATADSLVKIAAQADMSQAIQHLLEGIYEMIRDATAS